VPADLKKALRSADQVILDFPFLSPLFRFAKGEKWLNTHNAEFELWAKPSVVTSVKNIELDSMTQADRVIFCSDDDRQKFVGLVPNLLRKSAIVSNGVDLSQFQWNHSLREETRQKLGVGDSKVLLFAGSTYQPNREAFEFLKAFAQTYRAELLKLNAVILVVGTVSHELVNESHFKVMGRVESMAPYFAASDFGLNPVIQGSGVNVKMIEFMAAQLPILSTAFGCRGLSLEDRKNCYVFSRDNLLGALQEALSASNDENKKLSAMALRDNEIKVDMTKALLGTGL
jgi:glycosyltransferase involved in cell wall biosynthesis